MAKDQYGAQMAKPSSKSRFEEEILMDSKAREMFKKIQELENLKKANAMYPQDMSRQYKDVVRDMSDFSKYKKSIQENIEGLKKQLDAIDSLHEKVEALPFKIGDAVFVKNIGNVIINGITMDAQENEFYFEVVGQKGKDFIKAIDCLPINEATKVLYGKPK